MKSSCIVRKPNRRLAILREDYIRLCDGCIPAALLLAVFEYWTNVKLNNQAEIEKENEARVRAELKKIEPSLWIYKSVGELVSDCLGLLKDYEVRRGLKKLLEKQFIQKRFNPKYKWDRKLQYKLEIEIVNAEISTGTSMAQQSLDTLPVTDGSYQTSPSHPAWVTDRRSNGKGSIKNPLHMESVTVSEQYHKNIREDITRITHTQRSDKSAGPRCVRVGSEFSLEECRQYADHLHRSGEGITNPGGYATTIFRSGEADLLIKAFLYMAPKVETDSCPDCSGRGFVHPDLSNLDKGVVKCSHPKLAKGIVSDIGREENLPLASA